MTIEISGATATVTIGENETVLGVKNLLYNAAASLTDDDDPAGHTFVIVIAKDD